LSRATFEDYYRQCLELAREASSPEQRALLLQMAQSWKSLAEQSETIRDLFQHVKPMGTA
jgi:hypothetical protein